MNATETKTITITTSVNAPVEKAWHVFTTPQHIEQWNQASPEWHTPRAENDLRPGGTFCYRMEAKDGSFGFDFGGVYDEVIPHQRMAYTLGDGRKVTVQFRAEGNTTHVVESFQTEQVNPEELQRTGWQAILDSFRHYTESLS